MRFLGPKYTVEMVARILVEGLENGSIVLSHTNPQVEQNPIVHSESQPKIADLPRDIQPLPRGDKVQTVGG